MVVFCHSAKGGSGTSVAAAALAIEHAGPTLLIDFAGDAPAILGLAEPERPGILDWLASDAPGEHLNDLVVEITPSRTLLPAREDRRTRGVPTVSTERWSALAAWLKQWSLETGGEVIIDAGTTWIDVEFASRCEHRWLITRSCYLAIRNAVAHPVPSTGVVLIAEPGRTLRRRDVEAATRAPIIATIDWDPRVARASPS